MFDKYEWFERGFSPNELHDHRADHVSGSDGREKNDIADELADEVFAIAHGCRSDDKTRAGLNIPADRIADHVIAGQKNEERAQQSARHSNSCRIVDGTPAAHLNQSPAG